MNKIVIKATADELEPDRTEELKRYIRVGDKYMKEVFEPDKKGNLYRNYKERQRQTIKDDWDNGFLKAIKKYEGFCNVPSHTNYKQEIHGFFNEYCPLTHIPKEGDCCTILQILKHIFQDKFDFALDYFQLLYTQPTQRLPILLLESQERNTGKSSFGNLLLLLFQDNAIKLGNGDLESDFNAIWIKRLVVVIDETSLDKKGIMQMLKRLSTETGKTTSNEKNKAQTQTDFFGKFVFMSNEEGSALPIERGETRFAVFKVSTFSEKGISEINNIETFIKNEIPAFIHLLQNRKMVHKDTSRMYFSPDVYLTKELLAYYENSVSQIARAIKELVKDTFTMFPEQAELKFSLSNVVSELKYNVRNIEKEKVRKAIENELGLKPEKKQRYTFYSLQTAESIGNHLSSEIAQNNVPYTFIRERL